MNYYKRKIFLNETKKQMLHVSENITSCKMLLLYTQNTTSLPSTELVLVLSHFP